MIPTNREDLLDASLSILEEFGNETGVRGRLVALYLGLRRMGDLGDANGKPAGEIQGFLDGLYTKTHRPNPFVVLTAMFGGSMSETAPYSARGGETAPGQQVSHQHMAKQLRDPEGYRLSCGIGNDSEAA